MLNHSVKQEDWILKSLQGASSNKEVHPWKDMTPKKFSDFSSTSSSSKDKYNNGGLPLSLSRV